MPTKSCGNVFKDLGFNEEEATNLKLRSQLMIAVDQALIAEKMTQTAAAKVLDLSQPRISDLQRGKVDRFTIDALVNILSKLGHKVSISIA